MNGDTQSDEEKTSKDAAKASSSKKHLSRAERRKKRRISSEEDNNNKKPKKSFSLFPKDNSTSDAKEISSKEPESSFDTSFMQSKPNKPKRGGSSDLDIAFAQAEANMDNKPTQSSKTTVRTKKPKVAKGKGASNKWHYNPGQYSKQSRARSPREIRAFDISGIKLGMSLEDSLTVAKTKGFSQTSIENEIPRFMDWKYEVDCKNAGHTILTDLKACKLNTAKKDGILFISNVSLENPKTKEKVELSLTSRYTKNKVYKVKYRTYQDKSAGISKKSIYQLQDKNKNFWLRVIRKYGSPDNHDYQIWGQGSGYPYLKAETGYLVLEDPRMSYMDSRKMMLVDKSMENVGMYSF
ncbi:MAG: hypothetical protein GY804_10600 [Alphaproteobacteria bacterium]|nr:hypothetical protein [Alphaproteobacteria bacterium]